jgi:hypothetical protein
MRKSRLLLKLLRNTPTKSDTRLFKLEKPRFGTIEAFLIPRTRLEL